MKKAYTTVGLLKEYSPDIEVVKITHDAPGVDGWTVHICYSDGQHADFIVDYGLSNEAEMLTRTREAIIKQLKYHEANKSDEQVSEK
jgi:hypothetical protein